MHYTSLGGFPAHGVCWTLGLDVNWQPVFPLNKQAA